MARNTGRGSRIGSVKNRTQVQNPKTGRFIKRDTETGQFINQKSDVKPFKGVAKEPDGRRGMAKNTDHGRRIGSVRARTQVQNTKTDQFIGRRSDGKPFRGLARKMGKPLTQKFIERFAGSIPDFPEVEKLDVQERDTW